MLKKVRLQVPQGGIFGILGSNGAGKTTLLKILGTLILPTSGEAFAMGWDVARESRETREVLTYAVNEERSLLWRLTGRQNLNYFAAMNNIPRREAKVRIGELFSLLALEEVADRRVRFYSSGMRQKLALARGLLRNPEILLLDEPARSVDPLMAHSIWRFIKEELVSKQGMTVLFATHNLEEATNLCDRVAVLVDGSPDDPEIAIVLHRHRRTFFPAAGVGVYWELATQRHASRVEPATVNRQHVLPRNDETACGIHRH